MAKQHVCPWWFAFTFDNPIRPLFFNIEKLFGPYVRPGDTAVDIGCGLGFNAIGLARLVGPAGRVIAADVQEKMLNSLAARARRAGVADRIERRLVDTEGRWAAESAGTADFVLTFWMVHEAPDIPKLFRQIYGMLKTGGTYLLVEPRFHVKGRMFEQTMAMAEDGQLRMIDQPDIRFSLAAIFRK